MTIHFYTYSDRVAPSSRQRAFYVAEELEKKGYSVRIHLPTSLGLAITPWPKKASMIVQLLRSLLSIKKGDIIFLQRTVYSKYFFGIMVCYLTLFRRRTIFDFDDPVYVHSRFKTKMFCKIADAVITCTHAQMEWAKQFNQNVRVIHISLDVAPYQKFAKDHRMNVKKPVIGWIGTGLEHIYNLSVIVPVFTELLKRGKSFSFTFIGAFKDPKVYKMFQDIQGLDVNFIDKLNYTDPESAPKEINKFDIGIVPHLSESQWDKAKTSMKHLEYMACGVPTVVSKFGEMPYVFVNGVNGFICSSTDEWVEKISLLLCNSTLRKTIGLAGQRTVEERYSFDATIPQVVQVIESL